MTHISEEAIKRAEDTIRASQVLAQNADAIEAQCLHASPNELVVAVVTPDRIFGGARLIERNELLGHIASLAQRSWVLTFQSGKGRSEIEARIRDMAEIAGARMKLRRKRLDKGA